MNTDTQSRMPTVRGASFPYQFGMDIVRRKVVAYSGNGVSSYAPADIQRLANDPALDPHRHNLYQAMWEYWQSQMEGVQK